MTLSIANHDASLPVAYRLYLPKEWASDRNRRRKVGVPDEISFKTKPEIAEDPPLRPERHVHNSIATMGRRLVAALATMLSRCPCCAARNRYRNFVIQ